MLTHTAGHLQTNLVSCCLIIPLFIILFEFDKDSES
jgi:hypothetical protein